MLDAWYQYAATVPGFIGAALCAYRGRAFMFQEQQRNALGILGAEYDQLWLRLQAMPLPRSGEPFETDLEEVVATIIRELEVDAVVNLGNLGEMIRAGL